MSKYKLTENGVIDQETESFIPNISGNRHWREYQEWLSEGNIPDPQYTEEELKEIEIEVITNEMKNKIIQPVDCTSINGVTIYVMDGNEDSAVRFKHGIELSEMLGEVQIPMVDYYNNVHIVSLQEAYNIVRQQALYYRSAYLTRAIKRKELLDKK